MKILLKWQIICEFIKIQPLMTEHVCGRHLVFALSHLYDCYCHKQNHTDLLFRMRIWLETQFSWTIMELLLFFLLRQEIPDWNPESPRELLSWLHTVVQSSKNFSIFFTSVLLFIHLFSFMCTQNRLKWIGGSASAKNTRI